LCKKKGRGKIVLTRRHTAEIFKVDCSIPATDGIFDADILKGYEQFLADHIKVQGKKGRLGEKVKVSTKGSLVTIKTFVPFTKRYVKYLSKKYLKKKNLRDWLRVVATQPDTYQLRYFSIHDPDDEGEE